MLLAAPLLPGWAGLRAWWTPRATITSDRDARSHTSWLQLRRSHLCPPGHHSPPPPPRAALVVGTSVLSLEVSFFLFFSMNF